ncbi:glycosyl transferase family 2 [Flavobacterium palustre]|uniref:Glycosyl transferase family 2 n=1 Tax=Flavobacterium palustre TaxID=1476463 RepID=A0ABQ1H951_9FLAO|nr:glycosyltransferase [Flavobacterium palustre]GGA63264.1 glycosyl transferase family 2 [Flavobacterium palustre]
MKISAVIISFNPNCNLLFQNISSYKNSVDEIIVVDNSTDCAKKKEIKTLCNDNEFVYHDMNGNKGIAAALNIGFEYTQKNKSEWVLTMDQDSCFLTDFTGYRNYINSNDCTNLIALIPAYAYYNDTNTENKILSDPIIAPQSGNLVKLSNYIKLGPYNEDYFIDFVDYEYCLRARLKDMGIKAISSVILNHEPGVQNSISILGFNYKYFEASPIRYYYVVRNGLKTALNYKNAQSLLIVLKTIARVFCIEKQKTEKIKFIFKGGFDFLKSI